MSARFSLCDALANTLTGFETHSIITAHAQYMKRAEAQFKQEWEQQQIKQNKRRFWQKKKKALPADEIQRQYQLAYDIAMTRAQQEWDCMQSLRDRTHTIISATATTNSTSTSTTNSTSTSQVNTPKHVHVQ